MAKLLLDMRGSLLRIPKPLDKTYDSEKDALRDAVVASRFISDNILLPMEQFSNRAHYRLESVDVMHSIQTQLITGEGGDNVRVT
jgi:hypothetical protein